MRRRYILVIAKLLFSLTLGAQVGGESTYRFLSLTTSARMAALGGSQIALNDTSDLNLPFHNPSLLNRGMTGQVLVNYVNFLSDINLGYASYAYQIGDAGTIAAGMHYINYGNFVEATDQGELTGNFFKAAEYALHLMYAGSYKNLKYGAALKPVLSVFETYQSFGLAADAGVLWVSPNRLTSVGLVAKNFGTQLTTYYDQGEREPLPFDLQAGVSQKLAHAPLVISLTAHHLNRWKLAIPKEDNDTGEWTFYEPEEPLGKQIMRHLLIGVEVLPSPVFTLRAGYNYHLRQELKVEERLSTVGLSFGFGVKLRRFRFDYSNVRYHLAGNSSHFSIAFNLNNNLL